MKFYGWTVDNYKELSKENYIEDKNLDKNAIIESRNSAEKSGVWFELKKITHLFDKILVVLNDSNFYKNSIICDNGYYNYLTDIYEPNPEYQAFYIMKEAPVENIQSTTKETKSKKTIKIPKNININNNNVINNTNNEIINHKNQNNEKQNIGIYLIFQPYIEQLYLRIQPKVYLMPYINIDIYDCETQNKMFSKITLNQFYSSFYSDKFKSNGEYYIIITDGYYPMGYSIIVSSNGFSIKNMTRNKFYQQILNYKTLEFKIDFPSLEKDKLWMFGKFLINNNSSKKSTIRFKLNINFEIKKVLPFIKVFLENENLNKKRKEIMLDEFVTLEQDNTEEIKVKDFITIFIRPEFLIKSSVLDIEILYDNEEFNFELLPLIPPFEIEGEASESHNNGLIFNEYVYPSEPEVVSFLELCIRQNSKDGEMLIENGEVDFHLELYKLNNEPNIEFEKNSIIFSYSNIGTLVKSWTFYNDFNLTNIVLKEIKSEHQEIEESGDKKQKKNPTKGKTEVNLPYVLICYIKNRMDFKFNLDNIKWKIRIFSDGGISFVKDISKSPIWIFAPS